MNPSGPLRRAWPGVVLAALAFAAGAQPAPKQAPKIPVIDVKPAARPDLVPQGRVAVYRGTVDGEGLAFVIPNLTIGTPVAVALESSPPQGRLSLQLKNDYSKDWDRTVETDARGGAFTRFRTEGPAVALLRSDGPMRPYRLLVWVGPEVKLHKAMPTPFTARRPTPWMTVLLGVGALLAVSTIAWLAWRRRRVKA